MKKRSLLGFLLALLMLLMTACGAEDVSGILQGLEQSAQIVRDIQNDGDDQEVGDIWDDDAQDAGDVWDDDAQDAGDDWGDGDSRADGYEDKLPVYGEYYYDLTNVVLYLEVYDELPDNYITKNEARELGWQGGSVEDYLEGAAIGGDTFGNREGQLPEASGRKYTECDIDTNGYSSRGARRLVFSNDGLYFYTSDHYENFSEVTVTEDYEVVW